MKNRVSRLQGFRVSGVLLALFLPAALRADNGGQEPAEIRAMLETKMNDLNGMGKGAGAVKGALIGGGIALGVGGAATAITAFIESNNITCRIGDNLESVGLGKSGKVKALKDYYVQWGMRLPDAMAIDYAVTECNSWNAACNTITNIGDCAAAVITYQTPDGGSERVETACATSGTTCVRNNSVAISRGACN